MYSKGGFGGGFVESYEKNGDIWLVKNSLLLKRMGKGSNSGRIDGVEIPLSIFIFF